MTKALSTSEGKNMSGKVDPKISDEIKKAFSNAEYIERKPTTAQELSILIQTQGMIHRELPEGWNDHKDYPQITIRKPTPQT